MGTGTPTVTVSGLSAANAILKSKGLEPFVYRREMPNVVRLVEKPFHKEGLFSQYDQSDRHLMEQAWRCQLCQEPKCTCVDKIGDQGTSQLGVDMPGILRRIVVGNFIGAAKLAAPFVRNMGTGPNADELWKRMESNCILTERNREPVPIKMLLTELCARPQRTDGPSDR